MLTSFDVNIFVSVFVKQLTINDKAHILMKY